MSVLTSRGLKPKWERERFRGPMGRRMRKRRDREWSGSDEDDEEEASEEESVTLRARWVVCTQRRRNLPCFRRPRCILAFIFFQNVTSSCVQARGFRLGSAGIALVGSHLHTASRFACS